MYMATGSFSSIFEGTTPVLIDFSAEWCGPCKMLAPILKDLKHALGDRLRIVKIDTDKNPSLAAQFQIRGVPTLILFKQGRPVWRQSGVMPLHELTRKMEEFLA